MKKSTKSDGPSYILKIFNNIFSLIKSFLNGFRKDPVPLNNINYFLNKAQISESAKLIITNGLNFIDKTVDDIITPRSDIFGIKSTASIDEINQALVGSSHTRILVYEENLDNIIGFIHIKDLYKNFILKNDCKLVDLIRKPITVVPSTKLINVLSRMQQERIHLAVVADEYGGTAGIVTNENVIEALVGEIHDEHDSKNAQDEYQLIDETTLIANARLRLDKVEELLKIDLQEYERDCDTIGGIVIARAGRMPQIGAILDINDNVKVEVLEANKRLLKKIRIKVYS
jgi:magnesium and cobalt transporter